MIARKRPFSTATAKTPGCSLLSCYTTGSRVAIILGVELGKETSPRLFYPTDPV